MKLGLFGGTFDPIHCGHIEPVKAACRELGLDRVFYLPTAQPPHKQQQVLVPAAQRYAMVEIALLEEQELLVSSFEMGGEHPAYAVDSVRHFRAEFPDVELFLIMGSDSFSELEQWHEWRAIVALATIAVLVRPGTLPADFDASPYSPGLANLVHERRALLVHNAALAVSSSELRRLLGEGAELPRGWMPESVVDYIRKYSLYR